MRWISKLACFAALLASVFPAQAQTAAKTAAPAKADAKAASSPNAPLLPDSFSGWVATDQPKALIDAAQADGANAAAMKEYDFSDGVTASYKRGGETLSLRALRFHDASGSYGAYSFYRKNGW